MLKQVVSIEECLPPTHLARFIAQSLGQLDLSSIYQEYGPKGGTPIGPEILLAHEMRHEVQFITRGVGFRVLSQSRMAEEMPHS